MGPQEMICKLCLKICNKFKAFDGTTRNCLEKLLPKINLPAIQKPVMCINCAEMLKKCFDFKVMCFSARDGIIPFVTKDAVKLDLIDVPLNRDKDGTGVPAVQNLCGFCMSPVNNCSRTFPYVEGADILLDKMREQCLPDLDLSIIKNPVICSPCRDSLEMYFRFVTNYMIVEEKIKKYCETFGVNSTAQIELNSVLQFTIRDVTKIEVDDYSVDTIKLEKQLWKERQNSDVREIGKAPDIFKLEQMYCDGSENVKEEVDYKNESYVDMADFKFNTEEQFIPKNLLICKEEVNNIDVVKIEETLCEEKELKEENLCEKLDQKFLSNEDVEIKTDVSDFYSFEDDVLPHPEVATRLCGGEEYLVPDFERDISKRQSELTLTEELATKMIMYQCASCSFQTKNKYYLKSHLLKHKDSSEVTMYKCDSCSYQTIYKSVINKHLLKHKDPSEVTAYKCDSCAFQAKSMWCLRQHLLVHKDPSQVSMYKCDFCSFQTKYKGSLKHHSLTHKNSSELETYKCDSCSFQAKSMWSLRQHLLVHKDPSQISMYKCDFCTFQTKYKGSLKHHSLTHKNSSELETYKCDSCSFQTICIKYLKKHSVVHRNKSEVAASKVTMYKCDFCSFQSKYKQSVKGHLLIHKDPAEVETYKCNSCSFQTKYKMCIKNHLLMHKNTLDVTMYKCDSCSFQTRHKSNLKEHLVRKHKNPLKSRKYNNTLVHFKKKVSRSQKAFANAQRSFRSDNVQM